jgi:Gram-negative bacterial TonB protein C-terminal
MSHANSFASRNSSPGDSGGDNAVNSAVIQMDVPEPRVIEVTPPRNLTGNLTASYVNLPGERVLRSGPVTMHIQRSVKIPGDRIPCQRWLWRGHKKVVLGELSSRVDPQVSQLPVPYGSITVLASIDKDGYISNVKPLYGSFAFLPNAARAIHGWRYQPTYLDDKPIETQAQIEIDFHQPTRTSRP